jgi:integrase
MSVYKPKKSPHFHFDFQFKGNRFHGSTGCTTERLARQFEARERQKAALPTLARPPITVDDACGLYAEYAESQNSWKTTEYLLCDIVKQFGPNRLLSAISQRELMTYFAKRRSTGKKGQRSNSTINREIENMRAVWRRAEKARFDIGEMPDWSGLLLKSNVQPYAELPNDETQDSLLAAIREDVRPAVEFLLMGGWRRNEVLGLRWSDLDLPNRMAWTKLKGGDVVQRPVTNDMVLIIINQPRVGPFVFTYVCQRPMRGLQRHTKRLRGERYPLSKTVLRAAWEAARNQVGLKIRLHDLRHTRASRIVRVTKSLAAAQKALQHSNIKTTMRYVHVLADDLRDALDASESRNIPEVPKSKTKKV